MDGFDYADGFVFFVHFHLHHSLGLVIEFRANVPTCVFIILVLMKNGVDMNLVIIRPLHKLGYNFRGLIGRIDVIKKITDAIYNHQS